MKVLISLLLNAIIGQAQVLEVPFNPKVQLVKNTGEHAFVAPNFAAGDQRGPCPGLNAMANHNYIPRNGVATAAQLIESCFRVFGLGKDIAGFLTALAIVTAGAIVNRTAMVSIGKATPQVRAQSYEPSGLSGTHNKYESDASPMKGDLYQYKDADKLVLKQLENFLSRSKNNDYTLRDLFDFRSYRIDESLRDNCYCYFGPISFNIIAAGSHTFIYWLMSNKSKKRPRGRLTEEDILSWYSVVGENPFGRAFVEKRGILGENEIKLGENEGGFLGGWPSHRNTVNLAAMPAAER
nr:PREDICTED: aromatic peroxygenase-like [Bemisia tabaci]